MRSNLPELSEVSRRGDYARFRALLDRERRRLLARARRRVTGADADECVETAMELAFRRFAARPRRMTVARWLDRLVDEAIRTRPSGAEPAEDLAHTA